MTKILREEECTRIEKMLPITGCSSTSCKNLLDTIRAMRAVVDAAVADHEAQRALAIVIGLEESNREAVFKRRVETMDTLYDAVQRWLASQAEREEAEDE